jgi:hypothetical protein
MLSPGLDPGQLQLVTYSYRSTMGDLQARSALHTQ